SAQMRTWFNQAGAFALVPGSADAVLAPLLAPGRYTLAITDGEETGGVVLAEVYDLGPVTTSDRLTNLSTLSRAGEGDATFFVGFVVEGNAPKRLLLRAVGPALAGYGVADALSDVAVAVYAANGTRVARNENWSQPLDGGATADALAQAAVTT